MPGHDIITVGASAGGIEALSQLVGGLPAHLPAAVFVVVHVAPHGTSVLPRILQRAGRLPAAHPRDGEPIVPGRIYIAPPDFHLLVKPGHVRLTRGPCENGHRPAADPLFRTAARYYGPRVIGVVLSGALDDGTAGMMAVKRGGGVAVVQDPEEALFSGMPRSALEHAAVDYSVPVAEVGPLLARLAAEPAAGAAPDLSPDEEKEADMAEIDLSKMTNETHPGHPSSFACPDCGGTLWEMREGELIRFRCRVGHAWSPESLIAEQADGLEASLWAALRALEEQTQLPRRLAEQAASRGYARAAESFRHRIQDSEGHAGLIRSILLRRERQPATECGPVPEPPPAPEDNGPPGAGG
jgi:two-component system chemotaxis response regulator CheB